MTKGQDDTPTIPSAARASDRVEQVLARMIAEPGMLPGRRLPTERALSEQLGVPRSTVRTALARFEARGQVLRITGSGTYVAEQPAGPDPTDTGARDASPAEIIETRLLIEPRLAWPVVTRANSADIGRIRDAARNAEAAADHAEFEMWDGRFHQAIADATHNRLLIAVYQTITTSRDLTEWGELRKRSITNERRQEHNREHGTIVEALQARDAARAEAAIVAHLRTVQRNLLGT
jgi:DNA-binding FadR family transcriptional regulator